MGGREGGEGVMPRDHSARRKAPSGAVVLLSGGMDSTAALYRAIADYGLARALTFEYGQRHWIEIDNARRIAAAAYVKHSIVTLGAKGVGMGSLLTAMSGTITEATSVVPGRNLLFLWAGAVFAQAHGLDKVVIGACAEDQAGYLDCRPETFQAMREALRLGLGWDGAIFAPYINAPKVEILRDARRLGCLEAVRSSWSCYDPQQRPDAKVDEKTPCGVCPACVKRAAAWAEYEAQP
jgi:7-cyano-7-deazaguanine synthase